MSMTVGGALKSKVDARDDESDGPWSLRREVGAVRDSKKDGRTDGSQIVLGSKKCWGQG